METIQPKIDFTLEKALDKSKLVQVQVTVQGKNGTFTRMQWKNPADVKSTDKVIGNQSVLDQYLKDKKQADTMQTVAKNNFNQTTFEKLKDSGRKEDAMKYAKLAGVAWSEHPNPAINWMRCMMAVNKLNNTSITVSSSKKLNTSNISASWNNLGKKEKMTELLRNNSKKELMDFARANGITWKEDPTSEGINWMRASMAIQKFIDGKSLLELDSTAKFNSSSSQNSSVKQPQPKPPSDKLLIPEKATEREKALLNLINNITDEDDLKLFKSTGMIAEDDDAKEFLKSKLSPRYQEWKKGATAQGNNGKRVREHYSTRDWGKESAKKYGATVFKGIPQKLLAKGMRNLCEDICIPQLLYPRETLPVLQDFGRNYDTRNAMNYKSESIATIIKHMNEEFSTYSEGTIDNSVERRNNRYNTGAVQYVFDEEKDGFCSVLKHLETECPKLSKECDRMKSLYLEMIKDCDGNYDKLDLMLSQRYETIQEQVKRYEILQQKRKKTVEVLKNLGLTNEEIVQTLSEAGYTTELILRDDKGVRKKDSSGNYIRINLQELVGKDQDGNYYWTRYSYLGYSEAKKYESDFIKDGSDGLDDSERADYERHKSITFDAYRKVNANSMKLCGVKFKKYDTAGNTSGTSSDFDLFNASEDDWNKLKRGADGIFTYAVDDSVSEESDVMLANLQMIQVNFNMNHSIQSHVSYDCTPSQANDGGTNYEGNFDWLPYHASSSGKVYWASNSLTSDEVNKKLHSQLKSIPVLTPEFLDGLKKFVDEKGSDTYDTWSTPSTPEEMKYRKAYSFELRSEKTIDGFKDTPIYDLVVPHLQEMASHCPQMKTARYNTKEKLNKYVADKMEYTPFDFSTLKVNQTQGGTQQPAVNHEKIRRMREELAKAVHCSLRTCDATTNANNETKVKHGWDKGARGGNGNRLYGHITAVFKKSYEVRNSLQEEKFKANCAKLGEKPKTYFHGTNHSGACGIIGVDGEFYIPKDSSDASKKGLKYAGAMLGPGVYLADMAGKSAGYFGTWGNGYNKEGCLLLCEAILGNHYTSSDFYNSRTAPASYDSVSMKAGTNTGRTILRADEWCVRKADFVFPKYIMDMEVKNRV